MLRRLLGLRAPQSITLKISVVIEPDLDGYHGFAPAFKGLHVDGKDEKEVIENLGRGIQVYLESLALNRESLPIGPNLELHEEVHVPNGTVRSLMVEWPSLQMSGIS
jgi:predicted RNase H-like HicB family nuclease